MTPLQHEDFLVAVDFDGTVKPGPVDDYSMKIPLAVKRGLESLVDAGATLILWTCRNGDKLEKAKSWMEDNDVLAYFSYFNENADSIDFETSNKICARYYMDDLAVGWPGFAAAVEIILKDMERARNVNGAS